MHHENIYYYKKNNFIHIVNFNLTQAVVISALLLKEAVYIATSVALSISAYVIKLNAEKQKEAARRAGEIDHDLFDKILKSIDDPSPSVELKFSDAEKEIKNILDRS